MKNYRLYSFVANHYLSPLQCGLQTAHVVGELSAQPECEGVAGITGENHPRYGIPRPDLVERNKSGVMRELTAKMGKGNLGRKHTPEAIAKQIEKRTGTKRSEETKLLMKQKAKDFENTEEGRLQRARLSHPVNIFGITYPSKKEASRALKFSMKKITELAMASRDLHDSEGL